MSTHRLHGFRGRRFIAEYKRILCDEGGAILAEFDRLTLENNGKFSLRTLGKLAVATQMPLTLLDDCLPTLTAGRYASGTWERAVQSGIKAADIGVKWEARS
jgi:hypothetical protein